VQAEAPWKDFKEVIEYAKKSPEKFRCGTLGIGSINHFRLKQIMIEDYENAKSPHPPFSKGG